ncbi:MAG TPA: hypothetical protein PLP48_04420, partial [Acholeplasmataceae bacterium]|nr:hypothetical protein [Acholeplasmataceae bacterium]
MTIDESMKLFYYRGLKEWKNERGYLLDTCLSGQDQRLMSMCDIHQLKSTPRKGWFFATPARLVTGGPHLRAFLMAQLP